MPAQKYKVTLTKEERKVLLNLISSGKAVALKLAHPSYSVKSRSKRSSDRLEFTGRQRSI